MTLGEIIRNYRDEHNMSQAAFAEKSGISKGYISMLENNRNPDTGKPIAPTYTIFKKVAAVLDCSPNDLMRIMDDKQMIAVNIAADALDFSSEELMQKIENNSVHITNLQGISFDSDTPIEVNPAPSVSELSSEERVLVSSWRQASEDDREVVVAALRKYGMRYQEEQRSTNAG